MSDESPAEVKKVPKQKTVWFSCRATPGCEGKTAVVVFTKGTPGQLSVTRYRCTTCGKSWHVKV